MDRRILTYGLCGWLLLSFGAASSARADFPFFNFKRFFKPRQTSRTERSRSQTREFGETDRSMQQQRTYQGTAREAQTRTADSSPEWQLPVQANTESINTRRQSVSAESSADANDANQQGVNPSTVPANSGGDAREQQSPQTVESSAEPQSQFPPHVAWQTDLHAAHKLATETGKPILLVFGAEWCHYCKELEKNTLSQPEMAEYVNANFVPVHLDMGKPQDKEVAKILDVKPIPCTVVLSPNADRVAGKILGYQEPPQYYRSLQQARYEATQVHQTQYSRTANR